MVGGVWITPHQSMPVFFFFLHHRKRRWQKQHSFRHKDSEYTIPLQLLLTPCPVFSWFLLRYILLSSRSSSCPPLPPTRFPRPARTPCSPFPLLRYFVRCEFCFHFCFVFLFVFLFICVSFLFLFLFLFICVLCCFCLLCLFTFVFVVLIFVFVFRFGLVLLRQWHAERRRHAGTIGGDTSPRGRGGGDNARRGAAGLAKGRV